MRRGVKRYTALGIGPGEKHRLVPVLDTRIDTPLLNYTKS